MAKILVIDDERPIRSLLRAVLEKDHHLVLEASNGRSGLKLYREQLPHLVVVDLSIGTLDGSDLISELTRHFADVKVIAMTGDLEGESRLAHAKQLGVRQTLQKPFPMDTFLGLVRQELAHVNMRYPIHQGSNTGPPMHHETL
jgi:DNA-binding NtrC family response regulator